MRLVISSSTGVRKACAAILPMKRSSAYVLPDFTILQWTLAVLAALGVGISKSGLPGVGLFHVIVMASLFPGATSTGIVLPMLVIGDLGAVALYRRSAQWPHVLRTLPPACVGVGVGWFLMRYVTRPQSFGPTIGWIVLTLCLLQALRHVRPDWFRKIPHRAEFAWTMGFVAGVTTMLANAAGPVMALYLLAVSLPKAEFIGTSAWFFLLINLFKLPFSAQLGLITSKTLVFNALLAPVILVGLIVGRELVTRIPQRGFDLLVLCFAAVAALRLIGWL